MKQKSFLHIILLTSCLIFNINAEEIMRKNSLYNKEFLQLHDDMRKLWEDHIQWTRNVIISSIANLADLDAVTQRLLQNQDDIGNAFKSYYGSKAGNKLSKLLREHITIAAEVIADAIAGNTQKLNQHYEEWQENAKDIAKFLSNQNPHWSKKELKKMLYHHLELTTGEVTSRLEDNWETDIEFYDENHIHMLEFSDVLTNGIVKQFPDKF